jgi:beta-N-acetylhexosaminidase
MSGHFIGGSGLGRLGPVAAALCLLAGCGGTAATRTTGTHSRPNVFHARTTRSATRTSSAATTTSTAEPRPHPDPARLLGQMIVARFQGPRPSASFLTRIRAGQIGGVILFGDNVAGGMEATRALTAALQHAAAEGGNPPLLIMTDQEGGPVKRLAGPPSLAPADMSSAGEASAQGRATGALLRSAGVNLDLAPVADVESAPNFLGPRSFGRSPQIVGRLACAFARGLASENVAYTLKHFPGLGLATGNTDLGSVSVPASADTLRSGYRAYQRCGGAPLAVVMVSSASYPNLGATRPAVMSPSIYRRELPLAVPDRTPLTVSDDLQSPAIESQTAPARQAIGAGLDLLLYAQTEQASAFAYSKLLAEARAGVISMARLAAANRRIGALKARLTR